MTRKAVCALVVLGTLTVSVQAQESVPKPTRADAANVVKIISNDETKIKNYCELADVGDEIRKASEAGNKNEIEQLSKQAEGLEKTLGAEFIRLSAGLEDVDLQSEEGEELSAELDKLDKLCPPK
jgi:hypothetical protein